MTWMVALVKGGDVHVTPEEDLRPHWMVRECWCAPEVDIDDDILVHHALDGREPYESGERKLQ